MLWLFVIMLVLFAVSTPIAWSIAIAAAVYMAFGPHVPLQGFVQRLVGGIDTFPLLAIPFFILAGNLMNTGGITDRLVTFARALVGHITGGLAHVVVVTNMIMAGMSGSGVADAAGTGTVLVPAMKKAGYGVPFSAAIVGAAATIGPIIPPSIPMVVYGAISRESVGKLFLGGFIPGVLIAIALMIQAHFYAKKRNYPTSKRPSLKQVAYHFYKVFLALLTPVIILGGIATGFFTPTEAAAVAAVYALILGFLVYRALTWKKCLKTLLSTAMLTGVIVFIMGMAALWSWMITNEGLTTVLVSLLTSMTDNPHVMMLLLVIILLILGCFIEPLAIMIMVLPVMLPILQAYHISYLHFGVVMTLALMIGLLTPPFGELLFILTAITGVPVGRVARATAPYLLGIGAVLFLIMYIPSLVTWLPSVLIK